MTDAELLTLLNTHYPYTFTALELLRDSGSTAYSAYAGAARYFLRLTKPAFADSVLQSLDVQTYLYSRGISVPYILPTRDGAPSVHVPGNDGARYLILSEYLEGDSVEPARDIEAVGALVGQLHTAMADYPGTLPVREKPYYVDRYVNILRAKTYPRADGFKAYGDALWERIRNLPRGYNHGDLYDGNIMKTTDGRLVLLDFDTSCIGFPLYDAALICNQTDYFRYRTDGCPRTRALFARYLPEYRKYHAMDDTEAAAIYDMLALYHFALQANIIELYGLSCVDHAFFDRQLAWLERWAAQCGMVSVS